MARRDQPVALVDRAVQSSGPRIGLQGQHDCRLTGHFGQACAVAADHGRAERHRLDHGRPEALVLAREHHRRRHHQQAVTIVRRDASGAHDAAAESEFGDRRCDIAFRRTDTADEHESQGRVLPGCSHHAEQESVTLVRVRHRRQDDHRSAAEPVFGAQFVLAGRCSSERWFHPVRHHSDEIRVTTVGIDDGATHILGRDGNGRRPPHRPGHRPIEIAAFDRTHVLRVGEVLQIVDGQQGRLGPTRRDRSSAVVHECAAGSLLGQPCVLGEHASRPARPVDGRVDDAKCCGEIGMGLGKAREREQSRFDIVSGSERQLGQAEQLTNEIFLASPDLAGYTPEQVDGDAAHAKRAPCMQRRSARPSSAMSPGRRDGGPCCSTPPVGTLPR